MQSNIIKRQHDLYFTNLNERLHVLLSALGAGGATVHSIIQTHIRWHTQAVTWRENTCHHSLCRPAQSRSWHSWRTHICWGNGAVDTFLLFKSLWNDIHILIDSELLFPTIKIFYRLILREQINTKSFTKNYVEFCFELSNFLNADNVYTKEQHLPWTNCGSQKLKASMAGEFFLNSSSLSKLYLSTSAWSSTPWFTPYGPKEIKKYSQGIKSSKSSLLSTQATTTSLVSSLPVKWAWYFNRQ